VRLGQGNEKSAPPDDDWWAYQILIRQSESAGLPSTLSVAGDVQQQVGNSGYIIENTRQIFFREARVTGY
jgi:hypothetical protein